MSTHVQVYPVFSGQHQLYFFSAGCPASVCPHRFLLGREPEEMELLTTNAMATKQRKEVNDENLYCDLIEENRHFFTIDP